MEAAGGTLPPKSFLVFYCIIKGKARKVCRQNDFPIHGDLPSEGRTVLLPQPEGGEDLPILLSGLVHRQTEAGRLLPVLLALLQQPPEIGRASCRERV